MSAAGAKGSRFKSEDFLIEYKPQAPASGDADSAKDFQAVLNMFIGLK